MKNGKRGFTLVELCIWIVLLAVAFFVLSQKSMRKAENQEAIMFEGLRAKAWIDGIGRQVNLADPNNPSFYVYVKDSSKNDGPDGIFDEMRRNIHEGHPLMKFSTFDKMEEVYDFLKNEGKVKGLESTVQKRK